MAVLGAIQLSVREEIRGQGRRHARNRGLYPLGSLALALALGAPSIANASTPTLAEGGAQSTVVVVNSPASTTPRRAPIQRPVGQATPAPQPAPPPAQPVAPPQPATPTPPTSASSSPTSSPAPQSAAPSPAPAAPSQAQPSPPHGAAARHDAGGLTQTSEPDKRDALPHKGTVADFRVGVLGCVRAVCKDGHSTTPGVSLDGFLGGNIRGWAELGLAGGWGAITPHVDDGTNVFSMYGLDAAALQASLLGSLSSVAPIDLVGLTTTGDAQLRTTQVGPVARIHFIPRGRMTAFVGAGIEYNLFRSRYDTSIGNVKLDFHGLAVPIEAGLGVYLHKNVALMAQFDYQWTWYGLAVLDHPARRLAVPVSALQTAADEQNAELRGELPQFWNVGLGIRGRM